MSVELEVSLIIVTKFETILTQVAVSKDSPAIRCDLSLTLKSGGGGGMSEEDRLLQTHRIQSNNINVIARCRELGSRPTNSYTNCSCNLLQTRKGYHII